MSDFTAAIPAKSRPSKAASNALEFTAGRTLGRPQADDRGWLRLRSGARRDLELSRAAFLRARLFLPERRYGAHRRRGVEDQFPAPQGQTGGGARGDRDRQGHDLPGQVDLPDRHRGDRAGRGRRADGAARPAPQGARRRRPVRRGPQASAAVPAAHDRGRDLADGRRHPRYLASDRRSISARHPRLAGARAGRHRGGRGRGGHRRLQRPAAGWPDPAPPMC